MRRRRQRLQVSTFPFLAVLLCAMGSLILLMLVLDRRARAVARARLLARPQATAEDSLAEARRQAEWEQRRLQLHQPLLMEDEAVRSDLRTAGQETEAAIQKLRAQEQEEQEARAKLAKERLRLARWLQELKEERQAAVQAGEKTAASQAEMARLSEDLIRMERTLRELNEARQRQQQRYSLVPYRGKRGDNRKPVYLECTVQGLVFHPGGKAIAMGPQIPVAAIRSEVERRLKLQETQQTANGEGKRGAYVLMLVRPDGIMTYHRTLAALRGLDFDFGYEFIDRDWVLDFPADDQAPARQPWMVADPAEPASPRRAPGRKPGGLAPGVQFGSGKVVPDHVPGTGGIGGDGSGTNSPVMRTGQPGIGSPAGAMAGGGAAGNQGLASIAGTGQPASISPAGGRAVDGNGGMASSSGLPGLPEGQRSIGRVGIGQPIPGSGDSRESTSAGSGAFAGSPGAGAFAGLPAAGAFTGSSRTGTSTGNSPMAGLPSLGGGHTEVQSGPDLPTLGTPQAGTPEGACFPGIERQAGADAQIGTEAGSNAPGATGQPAASQPVLMAATGSGAGSQGLPAPDAPGRPAGPQPAPTTASGSGANAAGSGAGSSESGVDAQGLPAPLGPLAARSSSGQRQTQGDPAGPQRQTAAAAGGPAGGASGVPAEGESPQTGLSDPLARIPVNDKPRKPPARGLTLHPGLFINNRDWVIPIECGADAVVVLPAGQSVAAAALAPAAGGGNPLRDLIQGMIARRQATVRPGEPAYRPRIRFRVRPEGLRSYYLAYPALESLGVPMSRESIDADEESKRGHPGS